AGPMAMIGCYEGVALTLMAEVEVWPSQDRSLVGSNLTLTQSSWERRLPSRTVTLYARRVSFVSPSVRDATITLEGVGFDDIGSYTCKVATFPLGNTQASTYVNILGKPKVYVSAGPDALLDGANESLVATCIAEKGRPAAEVFWEAELNGRSERQAQEEADGTTSVNMRYLWSPLSRAQGRILTCVVRHPCSCLCVMPRVIVFVAVAPVVSIEGLSESWYVGQENVKFDCGARANPPPRYFTWIRSVSSKKYSMQATLRTLMYRFICALKARQGKASLFVEHNSYTRQFKVLHSCRKRNYKKTDQINQ
uniref:Ig-like domain-containing protein n=1 Tax=Neogobius melanostomus TaxID=47308 RepID=A0A8C6WKH4_9GOBI